MGFPKTFLSDKCIMFFSRQTFSRMGASAKYRPARIIPKEMVVSDVSTTPLPKCWLWLRVNIKVTGMRDNCLTEFMIYAYNNAVNAVTGLAPIEVPLSFSVTVGDERSVWQL